MPLSEGPSKCLERYQDVSTTVYDSKESIANSGKAELKRHSLEAAVLTGRSRSSAVRSVVHAHMRQLTMSGFTKAFMMPTRRTRSPPSIRRGAQSRSANFPVRCTCPYTITDRAWVYGGILYPNWAEQKLRGPIGRPCPYETTDHVRLYKGVHDVNAAD